MATHSSLRFHVEVQGEPSGRRSGLSVSVSNRQENRCQVRKVEDSVHVVACGDRKGEEGVGERLQHCHGQERQLPKGPGLHQRVCGGKGGEARRRQDQEDRDLRGV